jgi:mono/diheme cytochrome c family protein
MNFKLPLMAASFMAFFLLVGCGKKTPGVKSDSSGAEMKLIDLGMSMFRNRDFGKSGIACADCHAEYADSLNLQNRIYAGHSILGAARRSATWNEKFSGDDIRRTAAGAAKCALVYQQRGADYVSALASSEADALLAYIEFISVGDEPRKLKWTALTYPGDTLLSVEQLQDVIDKINQRPGSADNGLSLYRRACANCHDRGIGTPPASLRRRAGAVARIVRAGQKTMPFFSKDKLTDSDIADIRDAILRGIRE